MKRGCDISWWQGAVNYAKMKAAGVDCVMARAGSINSVTGVCYDDYAFATHALELPRYWDDFGFYWYFRGKFSPTAQADFFCDLIEPLVAPDLRVALDVEEKDAPGLALADNVLAFFDRVFENLGSVNVHIYLNPDMASYMGYDIRLGKFNLWIAHWGVAAPTIPLPWGEWAMWQYTRKGDGAKYGVESAHIDLDWVKPVPDQPGQPGDLEERVAALEQWAKGIAYGGERQG